MICNELDEPWVIKANPGLRKGLQKLWVRKENPRLQKGLQKQTLGYCMLSVEAHLWSVQHSDCNSHVLMSLSPTPHCAVLSSP